MLVATTGMAVSKHFCNEFLISTSLFADAESCCGEESCCHHETDFFQLKEDFQPSLNTQVPCTVEIDLMMADRALPMINDTEKLNESQFIENKPPSPPKIQTFLSLKQTYLL